MKVLKGILVDHSKKENLGNEVRFYTTPLDNVVKGDVFAVWAHSKLAFFKVSTVMETYEYLPAENDFEDIDHISPALNRIDFDSYKLEKAVRAKKDRLNACLDARIAEAKRKMDIDDAIKALKGDVKAEVKSVLSALAELDANPESALAD